MIQSTTKAMISSGTALVLGLLLAAMMVALVVSSREALAASPPVTQTPFNSQQIQVPLSGNTLGQAFPYPSGITVKGFERGSRIQDVNVRLNDFGHTFPDDVDVLLVGPRGQTRTVMSDVGGSVDVSKVDLILDDEATNSLSDSGQLLSGTFKPTNFGDGDAFPSPAPVPIAKSRLAVFDGTNPNGTWKLFVVDDGANDVGLMANGWGLQIKAAV